MALISLLEECSQETFFLTSQCNLECLGCALFKNKDNKKSHLTSLIQTGQFFNVYKKKRLYNLVGGNPLLHDELLLLVHFLKSEQIKIRLWTNFHVSIDFFLGLKDYVDEFCLSLPSVHHETYNEIIGTDGFSEIINFIKMLSSENISFTLHHRVTSETISWLPFIYDFVHQHQCKMWLHYSKKMSKDEQNHVNYYQRFSMFRVTCIKDYSLEVCQYVPAYFSFNILSLLQKYFFQKVMQFKTKFSF